MAPKKKPRTATTSQVRNVLSSQLYAQERKERLMRKEFHNSHFLDWAVLEDYGMHDALQNVVEDKRWFKVFDMREPAYKKITIEFLSTMRYGREDDDDEDDEGDTHIIFQIYGEVKKVPLRKIGVYLGYYQNEAENSALPTTWPPDVTMEQFWFELIHPRTDPFEPSKSINSTFKKLEHKLLHHILAHTLTCRKTSHSKLSTSDMICLYSLIKSHPLDLGCEVANFLLRQAEDTRTNYIFCGGYITQLLKGMGVFKELSNDIKVESKKISSGPFRAWGLVKVPRGVQDIQAIAVIEPQFDIPQGDRPSSSSAPPPPQPQVPPSSSQPGSTSAGYTLARLGYELRELQEDFQCEKRKNKKFRRSLMTMLKSAFSCINPSAGEAMKYSTSSDESESSTEPES